MVSYKDVVERSKAGKDISEHLFTLYHITKGLNAKVVVELGCGFESNTALMAAVQETGGHLYGVNILQQDLHPGNLQWTFIQGDDREIGKTWNKKIDHLFIDTSHEYEHTKKEIELWVPWVREGGVVTFHDTVLYSGGVQKPIDEYLAKHPEYSYFNFPNCNGLGVLTKAKKSILEELKEVLKV